MKTLLRLSAAGLLAGTASAQSVVHYWDFTTIDDSVGGLTSVEVGTPDRSVNATYGEAYPGAGPSLNNVIGGLTGAGGGYLEANAFTGTPGGLDFGTGSFSFSYWCYDDFAADQNGRGPRVFDCLSGTTTGLQLGTNNANDWNFRCDDDNGRAMIFNNASAFQLPTDQWVHVVGVVDRTAGEVRSYVNGALQATIPFADTANGLAMTGNVFASQDLQIGIINANGSQDQSQSQAIDDLAFYTGVLSASDAMDLATATVTPLSFGSPISNYCGPAVPNSTGASGTITASGSTVAASNNLTLTASNLPANQFGIFVVSQTQALIPGAGGTSNGNLCVAGTIGRFVGPGQILGSGAGGSFSLPVDLTAIPQGAGTVSVVAGETWNFQAWHRDGVGLGSNFTDAVAVSFN